MSGNHAVVIGASISGLAAARVLSERFDSVTLFDRDLLPDESESRKGVPQGRHGHGLLASGFGSLKWLFPGIEDELVKAGALPGDIIGNVRWYQHGYYKAKFQSGLGGIVLSRPLLEATIRKRVRALRNVTIVENTHLAGLRTDLSGKRITGVRIGRGGHESTVNNVALVVDASGRASRTPEWLEMLGYAKPKMEVVEVGLGYTSRTFRRKPTDLGGDVAAIIAPIPPDQTRVGFMIAMEGDRWIVSLGGWLGDHAPVDPQGFLDFARSLSTPDIYDVIKDAEPQTDSVTYAFPSNLRRRYDCLTEFPEGYLVIGDALCSFNPFYGQGMSVAALEALALEKCLAEHESLEGLWRPFFEAAGAIIATPWTIAAGSDFAFRGVTGPKPRGTDLVNWYLNRVHRAGATDQTVCRRFFDVANLLQPPSVLFAPSLVARVMKECLWPSAVSGSAGPVTASSGTARPNQPRRRFWQRKARQTSNTTVNLPPSQGERLARG